MNRDVKTILITLGIVVLLICSYLVGFERGYDDGMHDAFLFKAKSDDETNSQTYSSDDVKKAMDTLKEESDDETNSQTYTIESVKFDPLPSNRRQSRSFYVKMKAKKSCDRYVEIQYSFYDENGKFIGSKEAYLSPSDVMREGLITFSNYLYDNSPLYDFSNIRVFASSEECGYSNDFFSSDTIEDYNYSESIESCSEVPSPSVVLKRSSSGIVDVRPVELIFDVVNTDFDNELEGFLLCEIPDDTTVESSVGSASGWGAQYVSERFVIDSAPSQKGITVTLNSKKYGKYEMNCKIKYTIINKEGNKYNFNSCVFEEQTTDENYNSIIIDKKVQFYSE